MNVMLPLLLMCLLLLFLLLPLLLRKHYLLYCTLVVLLLKFNNMWKSSCCVQIDMYTDGNGSSNSKHIVGRFLSFSFDGVTLEEVQRTAWKYGVFTIDFGCVNNNT